MAKRKKKWRRGQRNPGLTVVFSDRTRSAIESMAADGTAKSAVVARLVEAALGITGANASTDDNVTATNVELVSVPMPEGAAIMLNGVVRDDITIEIELPDGRVVYGVPKSRGEARHQLYGFGGQS